MAIDRDKAEEAFKDMLLTQIGIAATISDKLKDKMDEYRERGKKVRDDHKDLDDEIRRVIKRDKDDDEDEAGDDAE